MNFIHHLFMWIGHSSVGLVIRESTWMFPAIETVHIFGIVFLVGAASIIDIRLLGIAFRHENVTDLAKRFMPWIWVGFTCQVITGVLLFASEATRMENNKAFWFKMILIAAAGLNALVYQTITHKSVESWQDKFPAPLGARVAGTVSIVLWFAIITAGRWIAYV